MIFPRVHCFKFLHHPCKLGEDLARECAGSRYNDSFLVEPFLGMKLIHWFIAIHVTRTSIQREKNVVQADIIRERFPTAMPIAEEEVDFPLLCL